MAFLRRGLSGRWAKHFIVKAKPVQRTELGQAIAEQQRALESAQQQRDQQPGNLDCLRQVVSALVGIARLHGQLANYAAAIAEYAEALSLYHELLTVELDPHHDQEVLDAITETVKIAGRVSKARAEAPLETASKILEWLRENDVASTEVSTLRPQVRQTLRQLVGYGTIMTELAAHKVRLETLRASWTQQPENCECLHDILAVSAAVGRFSVVQPDLAAAVQAYQEAFDAWAQLGVLRSHTQADHRVIAEVIEMIASVKMATENMLSLQDRIATARLLETAVAIIEQLDGDRVPFTRLASCAPPLKNRLRRFKQTPAPKTPSGLFVSTPGLPARIVDKLVDINVHDLAWQFAYWNLYLSKEMDVRQAADHLANHRARLVNKGMLPDLVLAGVWSLPFYSSLSLAALIPHGARSNQLSGITRFVWLLLGAKSAYPLNGAVGAIIAANAKERLCLPVVQVEAYLRFFCFYVRADGEPFVIIDHRTLTASPDAPDSAWPGDPPEMLAVKLEPAGSANDHPGVMATVLHRQALMRAAFRISVMGEIRMFDDQPVISTGQEQTN